MTKSEYYSKWHAFITKNDQEFMQIIGPNKHMYGICEISLAYRIWRVVPGGGKVETLQQGQRRRQDFFRGGTPRPLKGYHAPPAGGPGGEGPPDGSEVSFFQTMQSIRK